MRPGNETGWGWRNLLARMNLEPTGRKSHANTNAHAGGVDRAPYIYIGGRDQPTHTRNDTIDL